VKHFKPFQIRWAEPLGLPEAPYLYRYTILLFNYSIRLHHWIRSDIKTHFHDHACDFISICLYGHYYNVNPNKRTKVQAGDIWRSKATTKHYLEIPKGGAWTLLICSRPYHKWGFYVDGKRWNTKKYFKKFGYPDKTIQ
jgi:hypothetical protein